MDTQHTIDIEDMTVTVIKKDIKNMYLRISKDGVLSITAPRSQSLKNIRKFVLSKREWIQKGLTKVANRPVISKPEFIPDETHPFMGVDHRLKVKHHIDTPYVEQASNNILILHVHPESESDYRQAVVDEFYRQHLTDYIPDIIERWSPKLDVKVHKWRIKKMKTQWGSCHSQKGIITVNLELAKYPLECLEYVILHELVHFLEDNHSARFYGHLERLMPHWRVFQTRLKPSKKKS